MVKADKRMDLTIRRLVKAESRMEKLDRKLDLSLKLIDRMVKEQKDNGQVQARLNKVFIDFIKSKTSRK